MVGGFWAWLSWMIVKGARSPDAQFSVVSSIILLVIVAFFAFCTYYVMMRLWGFDQPPLDL